MCKRASSNAIDIVNSIPKDKRIIFAPDKNLGMFVQKVTGRELILWDGACIVHVNISMEKLIALKKNLEKFLNQDYDNYKTIDEILKWCPKSCRSQINRILNDTLNNKV